MYTDLPLDQLRDYRPEVSEPDDFDAFWERTLRDSRRAGGDSTSVPADTPVTSLRIEDVTFPGFGGDPVRAWFVRPHGDEPMPCVVELVGYGGGRGLPEEHLAWASAGFAHLVMDTRGQGSVWGGGGQTPDPHPTGPAVPGVMTRGIEDPESYYCRRLVTDAVRAVDHVLSRPDVLHDQVAVHGESQGGGLALAAGALHTSVSAVLADVPFLCHFARAVTITDDGPYHEIVRYLAAPPRGPGAGLPHAVLRGRGVDGRPDHRARAGVGGAHGPGLPAVDGVRRGEPDRRCGGPGGLPVQPARGRWAGALAPRGALAAGDVGHRVAAWVGR